MSALDQAAPVVLEHNRPLIDQTLATIYNRRYCVLLGPRFSGKTVVLRAVNQQLADNPEYVCAYISLDQVSRTTQTMFLTELAEQILRQANHDDHSHLDQPVSSSLRFRFFLQDLLFTLDADLVLMIDHLEAVPGDLLSILLSALRALSMEAREEDRQVIAVVAGALNLATVTVGESSPFRGIATAISIGDLDEQQSSDLLTAEIGQAKLKLEPEAEAELLQATLGDAHLIRRLIRRCAELYATAPIVVKDQVCTVIDEFIKQESKGYHPLREATRMVEKDLDLLASVLKLLQEKSVPRRGLPLKLSPDLDALYLTGLVRRLPGDRYQLRNAIYHTVLTRHFNPGRVGHLLAVAGRWDQALDHFALHLREDDDLQADLLEISVNAMYAADDSRRAVHFLRRALKAVFSIQEVDVWLRSSSDHTLALIDQLTSEVVDSMSLRRWTIPLNEECLETRVFLDSRPGQIEEESGTKRAFPLRIPGRKTIGVLTIKEIDSQQQQFLDQRDRELQLTGYLNQAARALQELNIRREQAETLHEIANMIGQSQRLPHVLDQILNQIGRVIPFDTASIQLLESNGILKIVAAKGFVDPDSVKKLTFPLANKEFPNVLVWQRGRPVRCGHVQDCFPHFKDAHYHATQIQSWLGVPLPIGNEVKGVITFDSFSADAYTLEHETLALAIASQAAIAIQRAQTYERKLEEEKLLQEIAEMTSTFDDLDATWQQILEGAMRLTGAEFGNISLVDAARGIMSNLTEVELPGAWRGTEKLIDTEGIQSWVATNRKSALVRNVNDLEWQGIYRQGRDDTLAELAVPIISRRSAEIVGIINLESPRINAFDEADQELLEKLAVQADLAVHNAGQYQTIQESEQRQKALLRAGQTIGQAGLDIGVVLQTILDQAVDVAEAHFGSLQVIENDALVFVATWPADKLEEVRKEIGPMPLDGPGVTVQAVHEGRALLVSDVRDIPEKFVDATKRTRCELAVVLKDNDRPFGVLNVEHCEPGGLDENDRQLLIGLANLAMVALKNAEQYKELEKAKDHLFATEAVAWMGLFGADWQHSISQTISSITFYINGLRHWLAGQQLQAAALNSALMGLDGITEVIQSIRNIPLTNPMPEELPQESLSQTMLDRELEQIVKHWCDESDRVRVVFDLCCPDVTVNILPQWLKIAMEKLINNALKAMPQEGELRVATHVVGKFAQITIHDTGPGIPEHVRAHFLKRAIRRRTGEIGSGMGSLIARFIARSHGGDLVLVESRKDYGTELLMTLPIVGAAQGAQR